jgi:hypothetical protein
VEFLVIVAYMGFAACPGTIIFRIAKVAVYSD